MYADKRSLAHDIHKYAYHLLNLLNKVRPNVRFTHKYYDEFLFFKIGIQIHSKDYLERSTYSKDTWSEFSLNFNSSCPISYENVLVRTLSNCVRKLYTEEKTK